MDRRTTYMTEITSSATISHSNREHKLLSQIFKENSLSTSKWIVNILRIDWNTDVVTVEFGVDEESARLIEGNGCNLKYEDTKITLQQ